MPGYNAVPLFGAYFSGLKKSNMETRFEMLGRPLSLLTDKDEQNRSVQAQETFGGEGIKVYRAPLGA